MRSLSFLLVVAAALACTPGDADHAPGARGTAAITTDEIDGHLRFLSSDRLEGRAPATQGGELAAEYIAAQLRAFGVEPGAGDSYFQRVPIDVVAADPRTIRVRATGGATATLRHPDDVVVWAGSAAPSSAARGEVVFVGYGSTAPEFRWDDFKDADVRGKILLVLVNDPPAPEAEPELFGGRAMTYYGRWSYKFEEAERRGAAGMLVIHTTEDAGYPWHTVVGSWAKEQRMVPRDPDLPPPLGVRGWITSDAATSLLRQAGHDLAQLRSQAASRDFRPVATGIMMDISFRNTIENLSSNNVIGVVRGSDDALADEYVVYSSHWDHLGVGPAVDGDSIYNGAQDNASGIADVLAIARVAAAGPPPRRSLLFVFVTAEESGLLGSQYFAENPTVPIESIVANINIDGGNLLGRVQDLRVLGDTKSSLGPQLAQMLEQDTVTISPDEHPERGYFYRSDHFAFAKAGIPAVSIAAGTKVVGKPEGWGTQQNEEYTANRYHQPSDEYRDDFDLTGAAQLAEIALRFGKQLANSDGRPSWNADSEFANVRANPSDTARRGGGN